MKLRVARKVVAKAQRATDARTYRGADGHLYIEAPMRVIRQACGRLQTWIRAMDRICR